MLFESFGFKYGIPGDADFVFDARSLPNPYWEPALRPLTGRDAAGARFLERSQPACRGFIDGHRALHRGRGFPEYQASNRRYLTVAIGCTGGQHRSVYLVERLAEHFSGQLPEVRVRHSGLPSSRTGVWPALRIPLPDE